MLTRRDPFTARVQAGAESGFLGDTFVLFVDGHGNHDPEAGEYNVDLSEVGHSESQMHSCEDDTPACNMSPRRTKKVSMACLALYFASRDVGGIGQLL